MSYLRLILLFLLVPLVGCGNTVKPASGTSPEKPKAEADLAFATISKKAYVSLEIKTKPIEIKEVNERLALTGWIMAKPGHEVTLTAPTSGYVNFLKSQHVPIAGEHVKVNQDLLQLDPVLSPVERIQVQSLKTTIESDLKKAEITFKTADSELMRTRELFMQVPPLKNKQDLELAQKAYDHAKEEIAAAKQKLTFFATPSFNIRAPLPGTVLQLHAGPGQYVPASAPLITIIDLNPIWIRVPIQEFDLPRVDPKQSVSITWKNPIQEPGDRPPFFQARPTGRVAQVDPLKRTADLWYELEVTKDTQHAMTQLATKDLMVNVLLPIGKKEKAAVVPYSAIVFDTHGNAYVYLDRTADKATKHQFERRRIQIVCSTDEGLIVRSSLSDGELLVTNGAAALYSREFHKTPVQIPGEDN
jgi:multidrug efflux pump subunit AcrA (membrane-fusion protein)